MADIVEFIEESGRMLESLHGHWFCPKTDSLDNADYSNPDENDEIDEDGQIITAQTKQRRISESKERYKYAYDYSLIFGMAEEQMGAEQQKYTTQLNQLMGECEQCVRNYHLGRALFVANLAERLSLDEETARMLAERLSMVDFERINTGLAKAYEILVELPPPARSKSALKDDTNALLALYEALCCEEYHKSNDHLRTYFDQVFQMIQTKHTLKLGEIIPAMTHFLFDSDPYRLRFATTAWAKLPTDLDRESFESCVERPLRRAIMRYNQPQASIADVLRFWEGAIVISKRLDQKLIAHSLRAMEVQPDIYGLAMIHLQYDSEEVLKAIIELLLILMEKAPRDFWAAYHQMSPTTFSEQIFNSPAFKRSLAIPNRNEQTGEDSLPYVMCWIAPFLKSLPSTQQYDACNGLLHQLLNRLQKTGLPSASGMACCFAGLQALESTLQTFVDPKHHINAQTGRIVVNNMLGLVDTYKTIILQCADMTPVNETEKQLSQLSMRIVRETLSLDCKAIEAEYTALASGNEVQQGLHNHSEPIWQAVLDAFTLNSLDMAKSILVGITPLLGLEKFGQKDRNTPIPKDKVEFNRNFHQLSEIVSRVFERLSDFDQADLHALFASERTAKALVGGLTSAEQTTFEAAVEVIKSVTGTSGRKEAIRNLIGESFKPILSCFNWSSRQIANARTFASMPRLIKTSRDILDSLCDSQDGILRTRALSALEDRRVLMYWWEMQWRTMGVSFEQMETWSLQPQNSKEVMTNFARDAMEHAEALFDQYGILASALDVQGKEDESDNSNGLQEARKTLLEYPRKTMMYMAKWLRLRDPYLASTLVSLVSKILKRLGDFDMECDERALEYIGAVAIHNRVKTILTGQQKAELRKAVDEHHGIEEVQMPKAPIQTKQSKIDAWSKSAAGMKHEPSSTKVERSGVIDLEKWGQKAAQKDIRSLSSSIDRHKDTLQQMRARQPPAPMRTKLNAGLDIKQSRAREKEEKAKRDAAQIAKAKSLRGETVAGEGSGLKGIGIQGKDHAPPRNEIMVNSDSESDSDDDDGADEAAVNAILKGKMPSQAVAEYEESKRRALALKAQQGPVKKVKVIRSKKDMRARIAPNLDNLHLTILSWEFFHDGDDPPSADECLYVANTFETSDDYRRTFHPLLISEAWRAFSTAKEDNNVKAFDVKIVNRMSVDKYVEVSTSMPLAENRDLGVMETDIILLSKGQNPMQDRNEPHCLARVFKTTRKRDTIDILYRISGRDPGGLMSTLAPNVKIRGVKITSMTTIEREYAALNSLDYYDLCDEVLNAKPSPILSYSEAGLQPLVRNYNVNMGQAKAIKSAKDNDAFTLIQGPPGSGKTKTIVAMVGALLTESLALAGTGVAVNRPQAPGSVAPGAKPAMKKLLICAPSNAAVDELVIRLKQGVKTLRGDTQKINVVRLGRSDNINVNVKDVTLDELVRIKLEGDKKDKPDVMSEIQKLHKDAGEIKVILNELRTKLEAARKEDDKPSVDRFQRDFDIYKRKQVAIGGKIDENKDSGNTQQRMNEINRHRVQEAIINEAHVLCSTLSGSGHDMFRNLEVEFDTVIIDEAAQCIELSALIPLKYGCTKCILVGDPKQLPPTVLSNSAAKFGYEQSLFVRMQKNHPKDVHLLDTQYRMHPEISQFPSRQFYDGNLIDGPNMAAITKKPWHVSSLLGPYRFFDVTGVQTSGRGHSFINNEEINVALQLYERLTTDFRSYDFKGKVGIITPYKAQLRELRERFERRYGDGIFDAIDFNTTDAYQGRESEIIIFSCVRARASGGIGFLEDIRRMNVGLTRAKSSLWVLGNSSTLMRGEFWSRLVENARERKRLTQGDLMSLLRKPVARDAVPEAVSMEVDMKDESPTPAPSSRKPSTDAGSVHSPIAANTPNIIANRSDLSTTTSSSNQQQKQPMAPSPMQPRLRGGNNGLNVVDCCSTCGSLDHSSYHCNDTEAKIAKGLQCNRCQEIGHKKIDCEAVRCMNCGAVGHEAMVCISRPMGNAARERVLKQEREFEQWKIEFPEKRRQALEGGHNPKMPTVQVSTPPVSKPAPSPASGQKRVREPSPSDNGGPSKKVPTGPRAMQKLPQHSRKNKDAAPQQPPANLIDPRAASSSSSSSSRVQDAVPANAPPKPPQQQKAPMGFIPRKKPSSDPFIQKKKPPRRQ